MLYDKTIKFRPNDVHVKTTIVQRTNNNKQNPYRIVSYKKQRHDKV